jgi:5-methyltetrahydrofolate--homocysteine methyltransferase
MFDSKNMIEALISGDKASVEELVRAELKKGTAAIEILNAGLVAGMDIVGEKMESADMFIPDVLMAAKAMKAGVEIIKGQMSEEDASARGRVVIGTVKGDLHDIGKNLVAIMMESAGLEVFNIGVDIAPEDFVRNVKEKDAGMLCLSALLTTTMPMMRQTVEAVVESGLRDNVKILIGGSPVTQGYADDIGADGYAPDAGSAAKMAKAMFG